MRLPVNPRRGIALVATFAAVFVCLYVSWLSAAASLTWTAAGNLLEARSGAAAALLPDGSVLVAGGWATATPAVLASVERYIPNTNSFSTATSLQEGRALHTATTLMDGRVLVTGGVRADGSSLFSAEIYDPVVDAWIPSGSMSHARAGHTATLLRDGSVLIAGGRDGTTPTNTLELFDPGSGTFSDVTGTLTTARSEHAAALLPDGRVLITGGFDGTNVLSSVNIYTPATQQVSAGPSLIAARSAHSATTLLDGRVLVAGGMNLSIELNAVELFDPDTNAFTNAGHLVEARQRHAAILLPHNNTVLFVGGYARGRVASSTEMYVPWQGAAGSFIPVTAPAVARAWGSAAALSVPASATVRTGPHDGRLLLAGGSASTDGTSPLANADLFAFATVNTDKGDYLRNETVTVTGGGWQPLESVVLTFEASPALAAPQTIHAQADAAGHIQNATFVADALSAGVTITLTATGSKSVAQTMFTNSGAATKLGMTRTPPNSTTVGVQFLTRIAVQDSTGATVTTSTATITLSSSDGVLAGTTTMNAVGGVASFNDLMFLNPGLHHLLATSSGLGGVQAQVNVNPAATNTTLVSSGNPSSYGQPLTLTATVVPVASGTATGTVTFMDGATVLASSVLSGGVATFTTATLLPSGGPHSITAIYASDGNFLASTSPAVLQTIEAVPTTSSLSSSNNPSVVGQPVTLLAAVTPSPLSYGLPTGTVQFRVDGTPVGDATPLLTVDPVMAGGVYDTCAVTPAGAVACWGDGTTLPAIKAGASSGMQAVTLGESHGCALTSSGGVVCWGSNSSGQLGDGTRTGRTTPAPVSGLTSGVKAIAAGQSYTCALTTDGAVECWGENGNGQIGDGTTTGRLTPTPVTGLSSGVQAIAAGLNHACAITAAGGLQCWGLGFTGELGEGFFRTFSSIPVDVQGLSSGVAAVSAGAENTCAVMTTGGGVKCWGGNEYGQLGDLSNGWSYTPMDVYGLSGVRAIAVGDSHACAATTANRVECWGDNTYLQLGISNAIVSVSAEPLVVPGLTTPVVSLVAGSQHTCALTDDRIMKCWGRNSHGQLGDGTSTNRATPTNVSDLLLNGAVAALSLSDLTAGTHDITVEYGGADVFASSTAAALTQTVTPAQTATSLARSPNPSVFGQTVTFTATVSAVAPGAGTPGGSVTFKDGGTTIGSATLDGLGTATFATAALSAAPHTITAVYGGDANFTTSTASAVTQTVNQASTTTALTSSVNPSVSGQAATFTATVSAVAPGAGTPTGTVTFKGNGLTLGTGTLDESGQATFTTGTLAVGPHAMFAAYGGDTNFATSGAAVITQTVHQASTTTTMTSSANPTVSGQMVTFSATVSVVPPGSGIPSGIVTFKDGGTTLGTGVLDASGQATFATAALSIGAHGIAAVYDGDTSFATSTSATLTQSVTQISTTTAVMPSKNPTVYGETVTFAATVSPVLPGLGVPTGTVTFQDGGATLGTGALDGSGQATFTPGALTVAPHAITAVYSGDTSFATSTAAPLTQTVNQASTSTAVKSLLNPSMLGQPVTFTATVSVIAPGSGTPTGIVTFTDGGTAIGFSTVVGSGQASFNIPSLSGGGQHTIAAVYGGNNHFLTSTSAALTQTVQADTTTTLSSSVNPSVSGQAATFTATVSVVAPGTGTPTGTVMFTSGGITLGSGTLNTSNQASFTTSSLPPGDASITAMYVGDANFLTSASAALTQRVKASTSMAVTSSLNPSVLGQPVTFTATVSVIAPGSGTPTGTVTFKDGGTTLGTGAFDGSGQATFTTAALSIGLHALTAVYAGDANFATSTSSALTQTVSQADTTTSIATSLMPSVLGQAVTFTATVSVVAPGTGTPTGTMTFTSGGTTLGTSTLNASRQATFSTSSLPLGDASITAVYNGATNFAGSTSGILTQAVNQATPLFSIVVLTPIPITFGQAVTIQTSVGAPFSADGTPSGTVTFQDGSIVLGTGTLDASGHATLVTSSLPAGTMSITVAYGGDANLIAATSSPFVGVVNEASVSPVVTSSVNPSVFGQPVTFTATMGVKSPGSGIPTGMVTFDVGGGAPIGSATLDASGVATFTTSLLPAGGLSIGATYSGDPNFNGGQGFLVQTVGKATTATSVISSPGTVIFGQSITYTATVSVVAPGAGAPTGQVTFLAGTQSLGTSALDASGHAILTTSFVPVGTPITAVYLGSLPNFNGSTSPPLTQSATQAVTTTSVTTSNGSPVLNQSITFTATVNVVAPGSGRPTGTVAFTDGSTVLRTVTLSGFPAQALFTTSALSVGSHAITAVYNGDSNFTGSTSAPLTQTVDKLGQTITFGALPGRTYGDADFTVSASTNAGLTLSFAASGGCVVTGSPVHITAAGACTITASQGGNDSYKPASVSQTFSIAKRNTAVQPYSVFKTYGAADPALDGYLLGDFLPGDNVTASFSRAPGESVGGSPYIISATLHAASGVLDNYDINYYTAPFTISPATLTAIANNAQRSYWDPLPALTGAVTGLVAGDPIAVSYVTTAAADSPAGSYAITPLLADPQGRLSNYTVQLAPATLTVLNPAPHVTLAGPGSAAAGDPDLSVTLTGDGFVPQSAVSLGTLALDTEFVSATSLRVVIPASSLAAAGVQYLTVVNGTPGGGTSSPVAFIVNDTGAPVESTSTGAVTGGTTTIATGGEGVGTPDSVAAVASGSGTVTVAQYDGNPTEPTGFSTAGGYFDVFVAPGSTLTTLAVTTCNLNGGTSILWYTGTAWQLVQPQAYDAATGCVTMNLASVGTSPTIDQLTGTYFAAVVPITPGAMFGSGRIQEGATRTWFEFSVRENANGADRGRLHVESRTPGTGKGNKHIAAISDRFVSDALTEVVFSDDPATKPGKKNKPDTDTVVFKGTGRFDGKTGYRFEATAVDAGEPGRDRDRLNIVVRDAAGAVVLSLDDTIDRGNIQSTRVRK